MYTYRAKGGELAQLHAVDAMVGAGGHAHLALAALPRRDDDAGLAVGQVLQLQRTGAAGLFALAAAKAFIGKVGQVVAVLQRRFHGCLQLLCALVQQKAEIHTAVVLAVQAGQHLQQLFGATFGAVAHLLKHFAAAQLLYVVERFVRLVGQSEPCLEHGLAKEIHKPCQLLAQLGGAQVVLTFTAGGQVQHDLFVQGKVGQCLPCEGRNAGAHHGIFAGGLFAADPDGVIVGIGGRGVPLHLLQRRDDAAAAAGRDAQAALGTGVPVLHKVRAGKDLFAIGADILALGAGLAMGMQVPALAAVDLGMGSFHQHIHRGACKKAHSLLLFHNRSDVCVVDQETLHLLSGHGRGHSVPAEHIADLGFRGIV